MRKIVILFIAIVLTITSSRATASTAHIDSAAIDRLIAALILVESNGKDRAIGDRHMKEMAYGPLQIRKPCVDDVNQSSGTKIKAQELLGNRALSVWVCRTYLKRYATRKQLGREPTLEDMARIWNGGPTGYKKQSTRVYWTKVEKALVKVDQQGMLALR